MATVESDVHGGVVSDVWQLFKKGPFLLLTSITEYIGQLAIGEVVLCIG